MNISLTDFIEGIKRRKEYNTKMKWLNRTKKKYFTFNDIPDIPINVEDDETKLLKKKNP